MKKSFIFSLLILVGLGFTACGGDTATRQLETEKAEIQSKFTNMEAEVTRLEAQEQQLTTLANTAKGSEEVSLLMKQYSSINKSLTGAMRRYDSAVGQYNVLIESQKSGTVTEEEVTAATKALQDKMEKVTKKAEMTVTELGRMKEEIEAAVKKVSSEG